MLSISEAKRLVAMCQTKSEKRRAIGMIACVYVLTFCVVSVALICGVLLIMKSLGIE